MFWGLFYFNQSMRKDTIPSSQLASLESSLRNSIFSHFILTSNHLYKHKKAPLNLKGFFIYKK